MPCMAAQYRHSYQGTPIADYERLVTVSVTWAYARR
jgi:hypothetical protein